jgi:hypothetical protein
MIFLRSVFCAGLILLCAGCSTLQPAGNTNKAASLDAQLAAIPFTQWAKISTGANTFLASFDGTAINGTGALYVPSGRHTLGVGYKWAVGSQQGTVEVTLAPGTAYILGTESTGYNVTNYYMYETIEKSVTFSLGEFGATEYAVPTRSQSIVEINLEGYIADIALDNKSYTLSESSYFGLGKIRFIVPPGKHTLNTLEIDVKPGRFMTYTINTGTVAITNTQDQPLNLIGKWVFDIYDDGSLVYIETYAANGYGWDEVYEQGRPDITSAFTWTAANWKLTQTRQDGAIIMDYSLTRDGNTLYIDNFLGTPVNVRGTRQ